ncbi:MAG: ATP-grasp domain-containing protein [Rickettsiales bacterium]|jgi:carbamoyl-phosphate synthase large subunit|nr:ATP-grasp domain-containing protein [Rickettsiales bacterium]
MSVQKPKKVIIIGSGANRIGQGIEFDYACVQANNALKEIGIKSIMINSNPETVSTDYDISDRLYFEPTTPEYVFNVIKNELNIVTDEGNLLDIYDSDPSSPIIAKYLQVAITFGGQTSLNIRHLLKEKSIPFFGDCEEAIEICDNRESFENFCQKLDIKRPKSFVCHNEKEIENAAKNFGYNFIIRPTSVIGGRGMSVITSKEEYNEYLAIETSYLPCVIDEFLSSSKEFDIDIIKDKDGDILIAGIMEQLEYAGVHSGDSASVLCDYEFAKENDIKDVALKIVKNLNVVGAVNIQIAVRNDEIYVIEVNPRISRTLPFIAKSVKQPVVIFATKVMAGMTLKEVVKDVEFRENYITFKKRDLFYVKESVFSFNKIQSDVNLGPEMHSTGEVIGIGKTFNEAFIKSQIASGLNFKNNKIAVVSSDCLNDRFLDLIKKVTKIYKEIIVLNENIQSFLSKNDIPSKLISDESFIKNNDIGLLLTFIKNPSSLDLIVRNIAILKKTPYSTNMETGELLVDAIDEFYKNNCKINVY